MERARKAQVVQSLQDVFTSSSVVIVAHYKGLNVAELGDLRNKVRAVGGSLLVVKNTLARRALEGSEVADFSGLFSGQTAIVYSDDPLSAAKIIVNFAKANEKLVVLGAAYEKRLIDHATVKSLATLPSLDELRAKLLGLINAPATRIAGILQAPAGQLARVLNAHATKGD